MLVQTLVSITVLSLLLGVCGTALVRMYRQQMQMMETIAWRAAMQRLERDFRVDLHRASSARIADDDPRRLTLTAPEGTVLWLISDNEVRRVMEAGQIAGPRPDAARGTGERFGFMLSEIRFVHEPLADINRELFHIEIKGPRTRDGASGPTHRISGLRGMDHRFELSGMKDASATAELSVTEGGSAS